MYITDRGMPITYSGTLADQGNQLFATKVTDMGVIVFQTETAPTLTATFDTDHVDLVWSSVA